jgi:uroporphyrinogen decarboxylase-like protein
MQNRSDRYFGLNMTQRATPREIVEELVRGNPPPRPLFAPVVFSLGAKLENLPLASFLRNATKITSAARQIRAHLGADGFCCYFDPFIEVEALGATLDWAATSPAPVVRWSDEPTGGKLSSDLRAPDDAAKSARIGVAVDVVRRIKSLVRDGSIVFAGVTGPWTLADRLSRASVDGSDEIAADALEIAGTMTRLVSQSFVDAGADLILVQEDAVPLSPPAFDWWMARLSSTVNLVRFYQALPALVLTQTRVPSEDDLTALQRSECIVCPREGSVLALNARTNADASRGVAVSSEMLEVGDDEAFEASVRNVLSAARPAVLTTTGDAVSDRAVKRLGRIPRLIEQM